MSREIKITATAWDWLTRTEPESLKDVEARRVGRYVHIPARHREALQDEIEFRIWELRPGGDYSRPEKLWSMRHALGACRDGGAK